MHKMDQGHDRAEPDELRELKKLGGTGIAADSWSVKSAGVGFNSKNAKKHQTLRRKNVALLF